MKIEELMVNQEKRQQFPSVIWKLLFSDFVANENVIEKQICCMCHSMLITFQLRVMKSDEV
jgi:hypothetical protein